MDPQQRAVNEFLIEARVHLRFGLYEEAEQALDGALGLDPESEGAHRLVVRLREAKGEPEKAIVNMLEVAQSSYRRGAESEAVGLWKRILELQPNHPTARSRLGLSVGEAIVQQQTPSADGAKFSVQPDQEDEPEGEVFDPGAEFLGGFEDDEDEE